jgi:hypothetical protein
MRSFTREEMQTAGSDPRLMRHVFKAVQYVVEYSRCKDKRRLGATALRSNVLDEVQFIAKQLKSLGIDIDSSPDQTLDMEQKKKEFVRKRLQRLLELIKSESNTSDAIVNCDPRFWSHTARAGQQEPDVPDSAGGA